MRKFWVVKFLCLLSAVLFLGGAASAQNNSSAPAKSREVSEDDGIPVLTKHLPDWENKLNGAAYILNRDDLRNALGARPALDLIEFETGTEAVAADYAEGKLLLVEYTTPQASVDADQKIRQRLAETAQNESTVYRRIGNYNVFVFETTDPTAAGALLDQIKYEKNVQWLGDDPFLLKRAERAMVQGLSQLFVTTVLAIVGGIAFAVFLGFVAGFIYFRVSNQKRARMTQFTDAGGMTRLNLDGFTPDIAPARLLNK